ncbi:MAG: response regulator, partial [Desulfobacterales bacterium]|nr:response regulator [Desulfobacterales bacterium]
MSRILAIDDNPDNLVSLSALLKLFLPRARVSTAQSGREGIRLAVGESPQVILLDIHMPGMDGFEVCRRLKSHPETETIPIIMLMALRTESHTRIKALEQGADAFLAKPINEAELAAQVKAMLRIKAAEDSLKHRNRHLEKMVQKRVNDLMEANTRLSREISQRKKMEAELRASETKFKEMFEQAPLSCQSLDENGCFTDVNQAWLTTLGYEKKEVLGKHFSQFLLPRWHGVFESQFPQLKTTGDLPCIEVEMKCKNQPPLRVCLHGKVG